ncbi:MAG: hypothetical protein ACOC8B_03805, partial [Gemmatimonadota bacterium]
ERARSLGIADGRISASAHCTRCDGAGEGASGAGSSFFSHRGGDAGRQMAVLGIRPSAGVAATEADGGSGQPGESRGP